MQKSCGNCEYFQKLESWAKHRNKGTGLCEHFDLGWASTDTPAKKCEGYRRKQYDHKKNRSITKTELLKWK